MLVFPYIRVSTAEQARDGFSIAAQKKRLTAFAQSQDWDIHDFYIDEGQSAKDTNRDDLQRLLVDIKAIDNPDKVVLVFKLDRLTRSVMDLYKLIQIFEDNNTAFRSATEVYDTTTAMGRLFITLVAALAQWERESTAERITMGIEQMVFEGKWQGGTVPLGFDYEDEVFVINEKEADLVRLIYKKYIGGLGDGKLAEWLNLRGYRGKRGSRWYQSTVKKIVTNPIYIQKLRWHKGKEDYFEAETSIIPRIMDNDTWNIAQKIRKDRGSVYPRSATSAYYFSGHLRCGRCGGSMKGQYKKQTGRYYYLCSRRHIGWCELPMIREEVIEEAFLEKIRQLRNNSAAIEVASGQAEEADNQTEIKSLHRELKQIKERRKKWQLAFGDGVISLDDLRERTAEDSLREKELREQLDQFGDIEATEPPNPEEIAELLENFEAQWENADRQERKIMIQILVDKFEVDTPYDKQAFNQHFKPTADIKNLKFH